MIAKTILIADDDESVCKIIRKILESEGMQTCVALSGTRVIELARQQHFDLIILDIVMDEMDGFEVVRSLRSQGIQTPIIMLSGKTEDTDKIFALGIGADDYVTKPFSPPVLGAKVKAVLRRNEGAGAKPDYVLSLYPFRYLIGEYRLYKRDTEIPLTATESLLMKYFLENPNRVCSKEDIYTHVWKNKIVDDNTIMVHIRKLRMKIEDDPQQPRYLRTVHGLGYQFRI